MTIVASILCIAIVAALHVTVVQKNPKLTNRVCITGANIILSLAFVVLLYAINTVQDEANSYIDSQIALLEQKVNEIYPDAMNKQMSTVEVKETLMKALEKNKDGTAEAVGENIAKTLVEDYTESALSAIQSLERTSDQLSVKDALVSIKEIALEKTMPYLRLLRNVLVAVYILAIIISVIFSFFLAKSGGNDGIVFGEEADQTHIGMKN